MHVDYASVLRHTAQSASQNHCRGDVEGSVERSMHELYPGFGERSVYSDGISRKSSHLPSPGIIVSADVKGISLNPSPSV